MNPNLTASNIPRGFTYAATHCGLKKTRLDLGILVSDVPAAAAAVFTTNQVVAAPVVASREHLRKSRGWARGIIVNSGNANCCTRVDGYPASIAMTQKLAEQLDGIDPAQILVCSTGVIGAPLKVDRILEAVPDLVRARNAQVATFKDFASAIMTTDTRPKWAAAKLRIGGKQVRLLGCAKGSGMIEPHMATMLAFIATDAAIPPALLSRALKSAVGRTFNSITVDGDTSTNDTVAVLANGESEAHKITTAAGSDFAAFSAALESICKSLALAIVEDGEGAQRVIEIEVRGASSDRAADQIGRTIANSPLVKTAFAGADPNWGRILAAAGRSGVKFNFELVDISVAGIEVCRGGREYPFNEITAHDKMLEKFVPIVVDLHAGPGHARIWTCDLTKEYIHINASYRT
ncbi:MAG TPA: bifunctional glutamate N-acetyltransferase/amino-acid acetyltransferase ArgJ [Candidatus Acidoferrales bacterium]|jgi:glutamate N-acetyltransferase/amino-acid N-acetyltransferase|nr:bifunctional glutamate N-acetyltransferase/amino-acid acetyltransferase ArgJ [Candidatus Acidoferrales bacterium]